MQANAFIAIQEIGILENYRETEPISPKDPDIIELSNSIAKNGVLQQILVRPAKNKGINIKKYELIYGNRRIVAARLAGLKEIPANIKEVDDEDVLMLQVTENLQRKDVHPMDEALAFKSLIEKKKMKIEDIAHLVAKSQDFVVQRMKLNDLIPELQKDFKSGKFSMAHALQYCRISAEDQKTAHKQMKSYRSQEYGSSGDLKHFINTQIINNLSSVPFKKDDETLIPGVVACKVCPKRSGANRSLFPDIKEDDRCFDRSCFSAKMAAHMLAKVKEIIETDPGTLIICDDIKDVPVDLKKACAEMGVKIQEDGQHFSNYTYKGFEFTKKAQGLWVDGQRQGKIETIYLSTGKQAAGGGSTTATKEAAKTGKLSAAMIDEEIKRIQDREKRSRELDLNKIHQATAEQLDKKKKESLAKAWQPIDRAIMIFLLQQETGQYGERDWIKETGIPFMSYGASGYHEDYFKQLAKVSDDQLARLVRSIAFKKLLVKNYSNDVQNADTIIRLIAQYTGIDLKKIEKEQAEIAQKRQERVKKTIESWKEKKAAIPVPKKQKAAADKAKSKKK